MSYKPSFTPNAKIINLIAEISEQVGGLLPNEAILNTWNVSPPPSLSAPPQNSANTNANKQKLYENLQNFSPSSKSDFAFAQQILCSKPLKPAKQAKKKKKGGSKEKHPDSAQELLAWLKSSKDHPLLKSCLVHFELLRTLPQVDGVDQLAQFWQTLILAKWKPELSCFPWENVLQQHNKQYQQALKKSLGKEDATPLVKFLLQQVLEVLKDWKNDASVAEKFDTLEANLRITPPNKTPEVNPNIKEEAEELPALANDDKIPKSNHKTTIIDQTALSNTKNTPQSTPEVIKILKALEQTMSRTELMAKMGLRDEKHFRMKYIQPGLKSGLIERTIPDKPNSRLQKYRKTEKAQAIDFNK